MILNLMMISNYINMFTSFPSPSTTMLAATNETAKDGLNLIVLGDFTNIANMTAGNDIFDGINELKKNAKKRSPEDFEFFVTVGDNLYPTDPKNPTEKEFE